METFFDTETTGLFDYKLPLEDPRQPRIVQIGIILGTKDEIVRQECIFIKPDGWVLSERLTQIHGITTEECEEKGIPIMDAVAIVEEIAAQATLCVAHNLSFDMAMYNRETVPVGMERTKLRDLPRFCTMKRPGYKQKWPKQLGKLHHHFFGETHQGAHTGLGDALATRKCYYRMLEEAPAAPAALF